MTIRSLKRQVIVSILLAETLCGLAFTGAALLHEFQVRLRALDATIRGRADSVLGAVEDAEDPADTLILDPSELDVPRADLYAVYSQDGRLIGASGAVPEGFLRRGRAGMFNQRFGGKRYRVLQRDAMRVIDRSENGGAGVRRPVTLLYASESGRLWQEVREGVTFYVAVGLALILLTAALMFALLRQVLHPIQELAAEAAGVSFRSLSFTIPPSALQTQELRPLAETLAATIQRLKQSFEQQTRFMGDAAHELKTAVAVVRSSIELLLLRSREPREYRAGIQAALIDNRRVEELVARMLVLARFEEQVMSGSPGPLAAADLAATIQRVLARLKPYADARHVHLHLRPSANLHLQLSPDDLEVMLSNLVINAVQHSMAESGVELSFVDQGQQAVLTVTDQGDGISAEALPHVFERFYREDTSRSRATGGAGLGLAICRSIVDAAGGSIAIESTQGVGTAVILHLPLAAVSSASLNVYR